MTLPGCKGNTYMSKARKVKFFPQTEIVLKTKTFDQKEKLGKIFEIKRTIY